MTTTTRPKLITTDALWRALVDAGGSPRLLKVAQTLEGIEISQVPAAPAADEEDEG